MLIPGSYTYIYIIIIISFVQEQMLLYCSPVRASSKAWMDDSRLPAQTQDGKHRLCKVGQPPAMEGCTTDVEP